MRGQEGDWLKCRSGPLVYCVVYTYTALYLNDLEEVALSALSIAWNQYSMQKLLRICLGLDKEIAYVCEGLHVLLISICFCFVKLHYHLYCFYDTLQLQATNNWVPCKQTPSTGIIAIAHLYVSQEQVSQIMQIKALFLLRNSTALDKGNRKHTKLYKCVISISS